jgi:hypothetical protein
MIRRFLFTTAILAAAMPLTAQGLADVARAEEARRSAVRGEVKVYTNESLRGSGSGGEAPSPAPASAPAAGDAAGRPAAPPPATPPARAEVPKDEKYWRGRVATARDALSRSQTFADALQAQINGLYTEFVNMNDPVQRAAVERKRLGAIAEHDRVKADIAKQTKALAEIEDEGRRANVPAGWLR